ncbi:immunoglobulin-like domain-containing protein [Thermococcus stetteri]|uniref:immunoglobulin-like domain-containing protein n=1 Tax=Thermococcus stetteri TaxID=49900 RepID=UPI001AEA27C8|nr:immunoglobulin-like domain-containing protein [Thermococcus stetteri]
MRRTVVIGIVVVVLIVVGYGAFSWSGKEASGSPQGNHPNWIKMVLDKSVYDPSDTMIIRIVNNGNANVTTSYHFKLYREENGEWKEVPVNLMFMEVAVPIEPGKSWEQKVNLADLNLSPGHYKIVKKVILTSPETKNTLGYEVSAEFDVKG